MTDDVSLCDDHGPSGPSTRWKGWFVAVACGLVVGLVLGIGMCASHSHVGWSVAAGVVVGVVGALAARSRPVLVALGIGVIVVLTSVLTVTFYQGRIGNWPPLNQNMDMIEHYGTPEQALLRITAILLAAVGIPCGLTAAMTAWVKRHTA